MLKADWIALDESGIKSEALKYQHGYEGEKPEPEPEPKPDPGPEPPEEPKIFSSQAAKTGDASDTSMNVGIMVFTMAIFVILEYFKKQKNKR